MIEWARYDTVPGLGPFAATRRCIGIKTAGRSPLDDALAEVWWRPDMGPAPIDKLRLGSAVPPAEAKERRTPEDIARALESYRSAASLIESLQGQSFADPGYARASLRLPVFDDILDAMLTAAWLGHPQAQFCAGQLLCSGEIGRAHV